MMEKRILAIDDASLPLRKNAVLYLNRPRIRPEPVLGPEAPSGDAPDNLAAHFYGTVLRDAGRFRMWYYACHRGRNLDWPPRKMRQISRAPGWVQGGAGPPEVFQGPICYAESDDGICWTKPALGQMRFKGGLGHNALDLPHTLVSGASVIRDDDDPDPGRRYKMAYQFFPDQGAPAIEEYGTVPSLACAVSPDGLRWTLACMPFVGTFVEHCSLIRHGGRYIVHSQAFPGADWGRGTVRTVGGHKGGRTGIAYSTFDFDSWPDLHQASFALPEPPDPARRGTGLGTGAEGAGYDQVHLGVGAADFGGVCVGLYGIWHDHGDFGRISCDLGLVVSNDGVRFREVAAAPGTPYIHRAHSPAAPVRGRPEFQTILCQGNGIVDCGDETRIYHGRWRNVGRKAEDLAAHYHAEVALAVLPCDRWGGIGLNPGAGEGALCSAPIVPLRDMRVLALNADGIEGLRVDLLDERFIPIPGYEGGKARGPDGLSCPVAWEGRDLFGLGGRAFRILLRLRRLGDPLPRLYALYLRDR